MTRECVVRLKRKSQGKNESELFTIILIQQGDTIGSEHIGESPTLGMKQKICSARTERWSRQEAAFTANLKIFHPLGLNIQCFDN